MIGNDLIALSAWPQPKAVRLERYRRKVFQARECSLLHQLPLPPAWQNALGWSLKEAAYKAHYREEQRRVFAPLKLRIESLERKGNLYQGWLCVAGQYYQFRSELRGALLHSLAWKEGGKCPASQIQTHRPASFWHQERSLVFYKDETGAPWVRSYAIPSEVYPASLSHDGGLHAWAWQE